MNKQILFNIIIFSIASAACLMSAVALLKLEKIDYDRQTSWNTWVEGEIDREWRQVDIPLIENINALNKLNGIPEITIASNSAN